MPGDRPTIQLPEDFAPEPEPCPARREEEWGGVRAAYEIGGICRVLSDLKSLNINPDGLSPEIGERLNAGIVNYLQERPRNVPFEIVRSGSQHTVLNTAELLVEELLRTRFSDLSPLHGDGPRMGDNGLDEKLRNALGMPTSKDTTTTHPELGREGRESTESEKVLRELAQQQEGKPFQVHVTEALTDELSVGIMIAVEYVDEVTIKRLQGVGAQIGNGICYLHMGQQLRRMAIPLQIEGENVGLIINVEGPQNDERLNQKLALRIRDHIMPQEKTDDARFGEELLIIPDTGNDRIDGLLKRMRRMEQGISYSYELYQMADVGALGKSRNDLQNMRIDQEEIADIQRILSEMVQQRKEVFQKGKEGEIANLGILKGFAEAILVALDGPDSGVDEETKKILKETMRYYLNPEEALRVLEGDPQRTERNL